MKHKNIVFVSLAIVSLTIGVITFLASSNSLSLKAYNPAHPNYYLDFTSSKNKFVSNGSNQSGEYIAKTYLGNDRSFTFSNLSTGDGWDIVNQNGSFYNTDSLLSVTQITITLKDNSSSFGLYWSPNGEFTNEKYQEFNSSSSKTIEFDFDNYLPNYIKFVALTDCDIQTMRIYHECSESHGAFTINYHLNGGSAESLKMSTKTSFNVNYMNDGYWGHYTTDAFIYYNNNHIDTKYAHKVGIVRHNIDNEYIVKEVVPSGTTIYNADCASEYFIIVHYDITDTALYNKIYALSVGEILRVDKPLSQSTSSSADVNVTIFNSDSVISKTYYDPVTLPVPSKDDNEFDGYYLNSSFTGSSVTQINYSTDVYAKFTEEEEPPVEPTTRDLIVQSMRDMSQYEWTPSTTITYYQNDSSKKFNAGTRYKGLPYTMGGGRTSTLGDPLGIFKTKLDTDNYTYIGPSGYNTYYGSDCSSSVEGSWRVNGITTNATYTGSMIPGENSRILAVGGYTYSSRSEMTKTICSTNGSTKIYSCYDELKPGDAIVRRVPSGDSWAGHVRLVVSIDKANQTVTVIEQCGYGAGDTSNTTWKVDKQYAYSSLFSLNYIPIRPSALE
ncbi:MAG: hypothetical protein K6E11_02165 [Bacilli bacterium]|nr:hypothetical protein [Bacilli bacterium]